MKYKIAVFPGDGVGPELINEGIKVIDKAAELDKFEIEWVRYPYGTEHYIEAKELLNEKTLKEIKDSCNAIYCGTFDMSEMRRISDHTQMSEMKISEHTRKSKIFDESSIFNDSIKDFNGVANSIRNYFDQFVSLRPIKLLPSVESLLAGKTHDEIDFALIREITEDFYVGVHGRAKNGRNKHKIEVDKSAFKAKFGIDTETKGNEIAYQIGILSRKGCERVVRYAFEYAKMNNKKKVIAVDKSNMLSYYGFWREMVEKVSKEFKGIEHEFSLIDAAVMSLIRQPEKYEVIVAPNLFGDILSDLGTMLQGGLSFAAQGNINPQGISMFEPAHGSAAKLKGQGIVNPIATIWAGALMLDTIGQQKSSDLMLKAIEAVLREGRTRTQELGGSNTTSEMGGAIADKLVELHD